MAYQFDPSLTDAVPDLLNGILSSVVPVTSIEYKPVTGALPGGGVPAALWVADMDFASP